MKKTLFTLVMVAMLVFPMAQMLAQGDAEAADTKVIKAKLASEEIEGDFMTVWAENFADFMREETEGRIDIEVYPYGTIGDTRDINELAQLGVVEFVFSDYAWISSFVSQANALALHYVWPRENLPEVLEWVVKNGDYMVMLEEKFRKNGLVPLGILFEGWQWLTSKYPVENLADMKGLKTRIMGSQMLVRDYQAYGIDTVSLSYGEIYSALQTGLIDAQSQPMFANMSMAFYEVADYFVQLWAEPFLGIPTVNMQFFDSLSEADQQLMRDFWADAVIPSSEWIMTKNAADMEKIKQIRPQVSFLEFTDEQIAELRAIQEEVVYPRFPEVGGADSAMMLEALLNDIENAKAAVR
jgi:TRAP-type C4-dicarboxylate transport system substrate-binding protein